MALREMTQQCLQEKTNNGFEGNNTRMSTGEDGIGLERNNLTLSTGEKDNVFNRNNMTLSIGEKCNGFGGNNVTLSTVKKKTMDLTEHDTVYRRKTMALREIT